MKKHCFSFLEDSYADICNDAMFCEKHLVDGNYKDSIIRAGIASEKITLTICEFADLDFISPSQKKRLETLFYYGFIGEEIKNILNDIREIRNKAAHGYLNDLEENAKKLHLYLYVICTYFYKTYFDPNFSCEDYTGPSMKPSSKSEEKSSENSNDNKNNKILSDPLKDYPFKKYNDTSYLLNELIKLNTSSIEAVEDDSLSEFKEYLHVYRPIQDDFSKALDKAVNSDSSYLIMLCGSVGDGKSHLIANLKKENRELFDQFKIWNDASESDDPDKDASNIDTLASILKPFNDNNITHSKEKRILAINLGVLNEFLDSPYINDEFSQLKSIIEEVNIFDSGNVSSSVYGEKVSFITFSDYNMFELNDDENLNYTSSKYISDLFNKITQKDKKNPFYRAYRKDKKSNLINPIIYNYEMFMDEDVQNTIIDYLIKISLKYRKLISTRDLLNFIYEIIVPPEVLKNEDLDNINGFMEYSLPNLLFGERSDSSLLKFFNELDPTFYRNETLDQFLIDLYVKEDTKNILDDYLDLTRFDFLQEYKKSLENFKGFDNDEKEKIATTLIRLTIFIGKNNIKNTFKDETYLKYLKYLYAYNMGSFTEYNDLFKEIKDAIFYWKGSTEKNMMCIDILDSFKVYKNLRLKHIDKSKKYLSEDSINRFKTEIKIVFLLQSNKKQVSLNVDYSLYESICKLLNGFKPHQSDKEDLINLDEFINELLSEDSEKDLFIVSLNRDEKFSLEYNSGIFEFNTES